jgi:hypothetical protein
VSALTPDDAEELLHNARNPTWLLCDDGELFIETESGETIAKVEFAREQLGIAIDDDTEARGALLAAAPDLARLVIEQADGLHDLRGQLAAILHAAGDPDVTDRSVSLAVCQVLQVTEGALGAVMAARDELEDERDRLRVLVGGRATTDEEDAEARAIRALIDGDVPDLGAAFLRIEELARTLGQHHTVVSQLRTALSFAEVGL